MKNFRVSKNMENSVVKPHVSITQLQWLLNILVPFMVSSMCMLYIKTSEQNYENKIHMFKSYCRTIETQSLGWDLGIWF